MTRSALLLLAVPALLQAQSPQRTFRIPAEPACAACKLNVQKVFTVGAIPGMTPGRDSKIARDSVGRYLLVVEPGPRVAVLDSTGKFLEFLDYKPVRADSSARNVDVRVDRDGVWNVYDGRSWSSHETAATRFRVGVLDYYRVQGTAPSGTPVSTTRPSAEPHRTFATLHLRVNPADPGPDGWFDATYARPPITRRDQFEVDSVTSNPACRECNDVLLDVSFGFYKGSVWTATADRYRINLFDEWGHRAVQSIEVAGSWLPLRDSASYAPGRAMPEAPRLTSVVFDQAQCSYVTSKITPDIDPKLPCERKLWISGLKFANKSARDELSRYATIIDVIGATARTSINNGYPVTSARVMSSATMPGRVEVFGPGLAYQRRQLPSGKWTVDVFRLTVIE